VTPRRCQRFKTPPGRQCKWTLRPLNDKQVLQQGIAVADQWGLVTLDGVKLTRQKVRLSIVAQAGHDK